MPDDGDELASAHMQPVKSKGIRKVAYDAVARTLDVEFSSSRAYRYFDVPPSVYAWFGRVESKGRFINRLVKDKYRFERLDGPVAAGEETSLLDSLRKSLEHPQSDD
jgi:hypothetical protein